MCYQRLIIDKPLQYMRKKLTLNQRVVGSNPTAPTNKIKALAGNR